METMLTDTELAARCEKRQELTAARNTLQDQIDELGAEIGTELALRGVERVDLPDYSVLLLQFPRTTIDRVLLKQRLLEYGLSMDTVEELIDKATTKTMSVQIRVNRRQDGVKKEILKMVAKKAG